MPIVQIYKCSVCKEDFIILDIAEIHSVLDKDDVVKDIVICKKCWEEI